MKLSEVLKRQAALKKGNKSSRQPTETPIASSGSRKKSVIKVLRTRETPNPNALQFILNAVVLDHGSRSYNAKNNCKGDKLGEALFDMNGVQSVFVMDNFVTVTKNKEIDWTPFSDQVWNTISRPIPHSTSHSFAPANPSTFVQVPSELTHGLIRLTAATHEVVDRLQPLLE